MRNYLFLSVAHAIRKYVRQRYDPREVEGGCHRSRVKLRPEMIRLPTQAELRTYLSDEQLDMSNPRRRHYVFDEAWAAQVTVG